MQDGNHIQSSKDQFFSGVRGLLPITVGVFPFALIVGISAVEVGLTSFEGIGMSLIVFAGAAQLAALQLIGSGAAAGVIVFTVWVINLRFTLYSASLSPHFKGLSTRWKALLASLLTDQAYTVAITQFEKDQNTPLKHYYYLGAAVLLWLTWQVGATLGVLLGTQVPPSWSLDFAIPLTFIALVVPRLKNLSSVVAAVVAGGVTTAAAGLPYNLGLPLGVFAGIGVGYLLEAKKP